MEPRAGPGGESRHDRLFFTPFFRDTSLADRLEAITAPTLILHEEASITSNEAASAIDERIPNSRLVNLEDVGHLLAIEAPGAFEAAVKAFVW